MFMKFLEALAAWDGVHAGGEVEADLESAIERVMSPSLQPILLKHFTQALMATRWFTHACSDLGLITAPAALVENGEVFVHADRVRELLTLVHRWEVADGKRCKVCWAALDEQRVAVRSRKPCASVQSSSEVAPVLIYELWHFCPACAARLDVEEGEVWEEGKPC
jgi:hypothetical protein